MPNDILLDENFDLQFVGGDLVHGESTRQHQRLLLLTAKGEVREFPTVGVGLNDWILDDEFGDLNGVIKRQFEADGMVLKKITSTAKNSKITDINTEAVYDE